MKPVSILAVALALAALALPSLAQYKVVGPDGRITYTDRPPAGATNSKVSALGRDARLLPADAAASGPASTLSGEVRQAATRYPVVLYASEKCEPCDQGRLLLQQRGIPFTEQRVATEDDAEAMVRLTGGRVVPTLTIGSQSLRGLSEGDWMAYLDAAGYPKESRLPRNFAAPAAKPLTERKTARAPTRAAAAPADAASAPEPVPVPVPEAPPQPAPAGIRF